MKLILVVAASVLLSLGITPTAQADTTQTAQPGAAALQTEEAEVTASADDAADRLNGLANQINQAVDRPTDQSEPMPSVNEILDLPQDTVVRGTRGGGLAIGTEF